MENLLGVLNIFVDAPHFVGGIASMLFRFMTAARYASVWFFSMAIYSLYDLLPRSVRTGAAQKLRKLDDKITYLV